MDFWGHNNLFHISDFKKILKIALTLVGKMHIVCVLLHNAKTCLYGNATSTYFDCEPPADEEYFTSYIFISPWKVNLITPFTSSGPRHIETK